MIRKLLLLLLVAVSLYGSGRVKPKEQKKEQENSYTYEYVAFDTDTSTSVTRSLIDSSFGNALNITFKKPNSSICGKLYRETYSDNNVLVKTSKPIETTNFLTAFDFETGEIECLYRPKPNDPLLKADKRIKFFLKNYNNILEQYKTSSDVFTTVNGDLLATPTLKKYGMKDFKNAVKEQHKTGFDVLKIGREMGLFTVSTKDVASDVKNFTVSKFIINLLTLNNEVVLGVSRNGDIIISKDVSTAMGIMHDRTDDGGLHPIDRAKKIANWMKDNSVIAKWLGGGSDNQINDYARRAYTKINSFEDYFDKKLFGLFYAFMGIAWGNVFSYASFLLLTFMVLYTTSIVGFKYSSHKLDKEMKGRAFEFPIKARLMAIGVTLVLSFVQYPTGQGMQAEGKTIQAKTSVAKNLISYLANIGTSIADVASSNSIVVYLDYLMKASHNQSYETTVQMVDETKKEVIKQNIRTLFYRDNCVSPYKDTFDRKGSFQTVSGEEDSSTSNWGISNSERWKHQEKLFYGTSEKSKTSLELCKSIEHSIALNNKVIKEVSSGVNENISGLTAMAGSTEVNLAQIFTMTQLNLSKKIGWISISTLPILHIFMLNSNIIETASGLDKKNNDGTLSNRNVVTTIVSDMTIGDIKQKNEGKWSSSDIDKIDGTGLSDVGNVFDGMVSDLMSYQVYMMLPAFEETRKSIEVMIKGSAERILEVVKKITPIGRTFSIIKSLTRKMETKNAKDRRKKNNKINGQTAYGLGAVLYFLSFMVAIQIYKIMLTSIFAGMVSLLVILKIVLYFIDVFVHFFVSPLIVGWKLTINDRTDKVHKYIVSGFIIYTIKPTLIVFSCVMFIFSYELMLSLYSLTFDVVFSSLELSNTLFEESDFKSLVMMGAVKGFGEVMVYVFGMVLAYFMILKGDDIIMQKFGYKDETDIGMANQLGEKLTNVAGGKI